MSIKVSFYNEKIFALSVSCFNSYKKIPLLTQIIVWIKLGTLQINGVFIHIVQIIFNPFHFFHNFFLIHEHSSIESL